MIYSFPEEYDPKIYLSKYADLRKAKFSAANLKLHFENFGKIEGRVTNSIESRYDFIPLIPPKIPILEIGPFYTPIVRGENVRYFDVLNSQELVKRAAELKYPVENIPFIHFVDPKGDLSVVGEQFDAVVSSHNIEHQPDLIGHLNKVERLLNPGGLYFCLIPDKRYCFDHYMPETTLADILTRHYDKLNIHYLKSVIEHRALTVHNEPSRHWAGDHGPRYDNVVRRINDTLEEYKKAAGGYIDVHAHHFTPDRFAELIGVLNEMKHTSFRILRNYHTRKNQAEFFVIMQKE
jgi:SAM-dependent methyltransferase